MYLMMNELSQNIKKNQLYTIFEITSSLIYTDLNSSITLFVFHSNLNPKEIHISMSNDFSNFSIGYKCYRPISGMCCPPMRCYNATWVEQQQHYWANCHPPTCYYPP